jgi:hypothetical protein
MALITFAGFSRVNGVLKFRVATNKNRATQLEKLGDTEVDMDKLPIPMFKNEAIKYVLTNLGRFQVDTKEAEALLTAMVKDENPFATPKKTVKVTVKKPVIRPTSMLVKRTKKVLTPAEERAKFMKSLAGI